MTNDAIINGKVVQLTNDERKAGEAFHLSRLPFAFLNNDLVMNQNRSDDRDHQHWLTEDYGLSLQQFEVTPRGYITEGRIQFFVGSDFRPMDMNSISDLDIAKLMAQHKCMYPDTHSCNIYNGVKVGKIGEIWPPIDFVGTWSVY